MQIHYNSLYHEDEAPAQLAADDGGSGEGGGGGPLLGSQRLRGLVNTLRGGTGSPTVVHIE